MLIGLTGKYCAGKNYISSILKARGLPVLDIDKLGYEVLEREKEAIVSRFGADLIKAHGSLDRRLLGQRVFGNPEKLAALEAIVHSPVNQLTKEWIEKSGSRHKVINAALLHRSDFFNQLDRIIIVTAPLFTRIIRARKRDRLSTREIFNRFASQKNFNSKYLSKKAEIYRVENPGLCARDDTRREKLERRIDRILEGIN